MFGNQTKSNPNFLESMIIELNQTQPPIFCSILFDVIHLFIFNHCHQQQNHATGSCVSAFTNFSKVE